MIYVTEDYWHQSLDKVKTLKENLAQIRLDKSYAYENCGDGWHDNPSYHHLMAEERMIEHKIAQESSQNAQLTIYTIEMTPDHPDTVTLFTLVHVKEENTQTTQVTERTLGIVPIGGDDFSRGLFAYNVPRVAPLIGAKVGETKTVSIPTATLETTIISIEKMPQP